MLALLVFKGYEPPPGTSTPLQVSTSKPKPAQTKSSLTFVSTFMMPNGQSTCNYYVTGNGFKPKTQVFLVMAYRYGNYQYEPITSLKIKTDAKGHFSYYLVKGFDFCTYHGRWIKTTAYDKDGNIIAEAEQQALGCE